MILTKIMICKKLNHLAKKEILENIPRDFFYMILTADKSGVQYIYPLRSLAHSAFQSDRLAGHILEVRRSKLYADTSDLKLRVSVMSCRRHMHVRLEGIRISSLKVLKLCGPCQRAYDVYIDQSPWSLSGADSMPSYNRRLHTVRNKPPD